MTTTDTRTPIWRRRWAQATGAVLALALVGGAAAGGAALAASRTAVIRPAANTAPATPKAPGTTPPPAPAAAGARPVAPAPASWIDSTGRTLVSDWQVGYSSAWTDANVLGPAGVYPYHYATFDQITEQDFGVVAPAPAPAPAPAGPQLTNGPAVVLQYYQDITNHDYQAAWNLGGDNIGGSDYSAWVAGYATTASISVTASGTYSDGSVWTTISATQTDGSVRTYSGTYTVDNGVIMSASITQTS